MNIKNLQIVFKGISLGILLVLSISSCSKSDKNPTLAVIDNDVVSFNEYVEHFLLSTQYKPDAQPTIDNLIKIVNQKAIEKMAVLEAYEEGIDKDSSYLKLVSRNERRLLYQKYVNSGYTNLIITDSLIQKFYSEYSPQYNMKFIMRPIVKESSPRFISMQKDTIEAAYKELLKGVDFSEVAKKYSQDKTTNHKGGEIGWIIVESMGDHVVRSVMDTLSENSYSIPFRGFGGYYILYKGNHRDVEIPEFESIKSRIWKSLYHSRKGYIQEALDKKFEALSKEYNFKKNNKVIDKILRKSGYKSNISKYRELNFGILSEEDMQKEICSYDGGSIILGDLFANSKKAPINKFEFDNRLNNISEIHLCALDAQKLNLQDVDELPEQIESMRISLLRAILFQKKVRNKVDIKMRELKIGKNPGKRKEIQDEFRMEFEKYLKTKYNFSFKNENFKEAIELAKEKKEVQNNERKAKKNNRNK
jgi:parvulin-like peptidyl-prolyl isomerase